MIRNSGLGFDAIMSSSQKEPITIVRQVIIYILNKRGLHKTEIAVLMGRDAKFVGYSIKRAYDMIGIKDRQFKYWLEKITGYDWLM